MKIAWLWVIRETYIYTKVLLTKSKYPLVKYIHYGVGWFDLICSNSYTEAGVAYSELL
jgi:hypothetical protein